MNEDMIECPYCATVFEVAWFGWQHPEYCPFCGIEMDYETETGEEEK